MGIALEGRLAPIRQEDGVKASEANVLEFIKKADQLVIPIYQRSYSWTRAECDQLWKDSIQAGGDEKIRSHFFGSAVYVAKAIYQASGHNPLMVIDGQQRLTTIALIIKAMADRMQEMGLDLVEGFSARKLVREYLINPEEEGLNYYKLILSETDRDTIISVMGGPPPAKPSIRIAENLDFFRERLKSLGGDLSPVIRGLLKLVIVDVALDGGHDNPQLIFESMNSTGLQLSQADLIRNFLLMGQEPSEQERLYKKYWRPMEDGFGQEAYSWNFDSFVRHYLSLKRGEIPKISQVYLLFKSYARDMADMGEEGLLADLARHAKFYQAIALGDEKDKLLAQVFLDLREFKANVTYPLLLGLYGHYREGSLSRDDFLAIIRLVESYVFRRWACGIGAHSHNKTFVSLARSLGSAPPLERLSAQLLLMRTYRLFPSDEEFAKELRTRNLYAWKPHYSLRKLENYGHKEPIAVSNYQIEHVMPQNPNLSEEWRRDLGPDWERVHETWLHTLGNLTLTGYNSEYSDRPFAEKRDMPGGFKESHLFLNKDVAEAEAWNEEAIARRGERLAARALEIWKAPDLPEEVLERHRPSGEGISYSISDHPHLQAPGVNKLFEAFRREVLGFDPSVTENFLKLYVAYKAETNFVDVIPRAKGLVLTINMAFQDLVDPRGLAKDITGIGAWGNGDVQFALESLKDLNYAVYLARQSFDRQMGEVAGE